MDQDTITGIYNELDWEEYHLRRLQKKRHAFVKRAAWSTEMCAQVDDLNAEIQETEDYIQHLKSLLQSNESSSSALAGIGGD